MIRIGDLRGKPPRATTSHPSETLPAINDETIRRLLAAEARLLKLIAPSEYKALMSDVGLGLLRRTTTVDEVVLRIDEALERAEKAMRDARTQVRKLADAIAAEESHATEGAP